MTENITKYSDMIPFNRPSLVGQELEYMTRAINFGHISGDGFFSKKCHSFLQSELKVPRALLTTSGTHALELAALLLGIQPGDEVVVPSFTFVSTINAFILRGAQPVFCDVREDTLNLDEKLLDSCVTERTRAIVPVHYAGVACEMDAIMALSQARGIPVVEDNAHGLFGKYRDKYLGTFGALAAQSFHETKNFSCGEGGALLVNDPRFIERAEILREKGTDRSRFFRGQVDKYSWVDLGSSLLPSDLLAAFLFAQLSKRKAIQAKRQQIWSRYDTELKKWAAANSVRLPVVPEDCEHSAHMFYLLLPDFESREALIASLRAQSIYAVFHYLPLHLSTMGRKYGGAPGDCPVTESVSDRLVRLPFYYALTEAEQSRVIQAVREFTP